MNWLSKRLEASPRNDVAMIATVTIKTGLKSANMLTRGWRWTNEEMPTIQESLITEEPTI
jgi:hypothetical protein